MELVEMEASKQKGRGIAEQSWVCTQPPQLQQREMESSNYYTFCSTDGKLFREAFYWRRDKNADEFKQISTTLNYYTIVRQTYWDSSACGEILE